jgi:hypothetical protein
MARPVGEQQEAVAVLNANILAAVMHAGVGCELLLWQHKVRNFERLRQRADEVFVPAQRGCRHPQVVLNP